MHTSSSPRRMTAFENGGSIKVHAPGHVAGRIAPHLREALHLCRCVATEQTMGNTLCGTAAARTEARAVRIARRAARRDARRARRAARREARLAAKGVCLHVQPGSKAASERLIITLCLWVVLVSLTATTCGAHGQRDTLCTCTLTRHVALHHDTSPVPVLSGGLGCPQTAPRRSCSLLRPQRSGRGCE